MWNIPAQNSEKAAGGGRQNLRRERERRTSDSAAQIIAIFKRGIAGRGRALPPSKDGEKTDGALHAEQRQ